MFDSMVSARHLGGGLEDDLPEFGSPGGWDGGFGVFADPSVDDDATDEWDDDDDFDDGKDEDDDDAEIDEEYEEDDLADDDEDI